jgi:GLPGLI family protein
MKKTIFLLSILFFPALIFSQNFQGIAYYVSQTSMKNFSISSPDMTPEMNQKMRENMKKAFEKTYILSFTNFESLYQEEEKLNAPKPSSSNIKVEVAFSGGGNRSKYYKNLKTKKYLNEAEIFDKEFLIDDDLEVFNWTMVNEQKMIGNYTCYKAQIVIPVTAEEKKEFEEFKIKKEEGKTNFFIPMEPKDKIIEAWYTLDIPIPNGPREYWGLPGLILELHDGDTTLLCSKIILNPSEKIEIKIPKSGKKVTQKVFDEIEEKKMKSMMNEDGVIEIKMN